MKKKQKQPVIFDEMHICCPYYMKSLKECPSSKKILFPEDIKKIKESCMNVNFIQCKYYIEYLEKAA